MHHYGVYKYLIPYKCFLGRMARATFPLALSIILVLIKITSLMTLLSTSTSDTCFTLSQATNIKTNFTSFLHIFTIRLLPCRMLIGLLIILYLFILFYNGFFSFLSISTVEKTEMEKRHARVKRWTKNVDIFTKDFLIVPVHLTNHWILAIICYPGPVEVNANQPRRSKRLASQATVNITINLSLPIFFCN